MRGKKASRVDDEANQKIADLCSSIVEGTIWVVDLFPVRDLYKEMGFVFAFLLLETV